MPIRTEHYLLEAFLDGDAYLAIADKRRFSTVDNQIHRFSEIIEDGRIDGWEIFDYSFPRVRVSPGSGFIGKYYTNTFDDKYFDLSPNGTFYFYSQRKTGILGVVGPKSEVGVATYTDSGPPVTPSDFSATVLNEFTVALDWLDNTEPDLAHYKVYRSDNGDPFKLISTISAGSSYFEDSVDEDSNLAYRLYAVDQSGYASDPATDSAITPLSDNLPPNPTDVSMPFSEAAINVLWTRPQGISLSKIDHYQISYVELNSDGSENSDTLNEFSVNKNLFYDRIDDLKIGQLYKVTLRTVDTKGRQSTGVSINVSPQPTPAPRDPQALAYSMVASPGGVQVNLSWTDGDTPYDPAISYRYKIYVKVDSNAESLGIDVPIGFTEEQISLYTYNLIEYFSIPENEVVTFRITALDNRGFESFGNYIRLETEIFSAAQRLRNVSSTFDPSTRRITVSWVNNDDTDDINIVVLEDSLNDSYINANEIINEFIGKTNIYVIENVQLDYKYSIFLTPYNVEDIAGPTSATVEITLIPGGLPLPEPPSLVEARSNDSQISLRWNESSSLYTSEYRIYKKEGSVTLDFDDWSILDTLPVRTLNFVDYGLTNDSTYSYYITAIDVYGRESPHLNTEAINLNFVEAIPSESGSLTPPEDVVVTILPDFTIELSWDSLLEEFDSFSIYRSINNLHSWEFLTSVDRETFSYHDIQIPLVDGTTFYYTIDKTINDADIVVQSTTKIPSGSIFLAKVVTSDESIQSINVVNRRDIKDLLDPLSEKVQSYLLPHRHRGIRKYDPDRIDLNSDLVVTDWTTVDGRIYTTEEEDIFGTSYIVKINGRFPSTFFRVDAITRRLIFSEPIVEFDPESGLVVGEEPTIEVRVLGIEEVQGVLDDFRFDNVHARQIQYDQINKEQLPPINHEGRIFETMIPKRFLLERFSNNIFSVPQGNTDTTKTFGDGTTFYAVTESDGHIDQLFDFDLRDDGDLVGFQKPSYSVTTTANLKQYTTNGELSSGNDVAVDYIFDNSRLYVVSTGMNLFSVNKTTLNTGQVSSGSTSVSSITLDSSNQIAYVASGAAASAPLYTIDIATGNITLATTVSMGATVSILAMAYNENNNTLYACLFNSVGPTSTLVTINPTTGATTTIGTMDPLTAGSGVCGMGYDQTNSIMYGVNDKTASPLFTINLSTGATASVGNTGIAQIFSGLTFDHASGLCYGLTTTQELVSINASSGAGTIVGTVSIANAVDLVAPPKDLSFYINHTDNVHGSSSIRFGNYIGCSTNTYLRFPVNVPTERSISKCTLIFKGNGSEESTGNNVRLQLSVLNPSGMSDTVDLSSESIKTVDTSGAIVWSPLQFSLNEQSDNTEVDITSLIQTFIEDADHFSGRHAIIKLSTLSTTSSGHHRAATTYGSSGSPYVDIKYVVDVAEVNSDPGGFQTEKSYRLKFQFEDDSPYRWIRVTTEDTPVKPNPIIDLKKRIRFKVLLTKGSVYLALGIREINPQGDFEIGGDGGRAGPIEWVGITDVITDDNGDKVPLGILIEPKDDWQDMDIDLQKATVVSFENGNSSLSLDFGVLEHLAVTINPDNQNSTDEIEMYIDEVEQVSDLLVAGTSQGIQTSGDFGTKWTLSRYTDTPVHKFYKALNNPYLWAISANQVFLAKDPQHWFLVRGTTGVQYIRDIIDDSEGNMYISTDKGVYWLDIALLRNFGQFRQTVPISAFSSDCYGLYHNHLSSGADQIWVSTEIGIFRTSNKGLSWEDTGLNTEGLVAYQFTNISNDVSSPNIIAMTRKHILRKMNSSSFETIANFESQHGIFDLWKFSYFDGKIYVSTGSGIYQNTIGSLFTPGVVDIPFEKVFAGIDRNGITGIAFGLDAVDLGDQGERLFIGLENKLMASKPGNILGSRIEYDKESPSFFLTNEEIKIGFIYNSFNKVLCFREPVSVLDIVSAANLPRRTFYAINGGWSQTNPEAEVFIYKNGLPTWLDWKLDENEILSEIQVVEGALNNVGTLNTFNSLYPKSQEFFDTCLSDIQTIKAGGTNESGEPIPLITNETIVKFMDDYTRFLSLITDVLKTSAGLFLPKIPIAGIRREDRKAGSRAETIEDKEEFEAENSINLTIDTVTGALDFTKAYTEATNPEDKAKYEFDKFEDVRITVFNANIKNTGSLVHKEIEDRMEEKNSGLTSYLIKAASANLIKAGIYLEKRHPYMFDRYNVSNIQSKFYAAHTNDWYDIINSTIDYNVIIKISGETKSRFSTCYLIFEDDPYFAGRFWVGTDCGIIEYTIDENGVLSISNQISVHDNSEKYIWDITKDGSDIYVVAQNNSSLVSKLYKTSDLGGSWTVLDSINLPEKFYNIKIINGNAVIGSEEGLFYSDNNFESWFKTSVVFPEGESVNNDASTAFGGRIFNTLQDIFLVVESDRWFYTSRNGLEFLSIGRITNNSCSIVNKIIRHQHLTFVATDKGLYNDGNSIFSENISFGLETRLEGDASSSAQVAVNDIVSNGDALYCCSSNGKIYRFYDSTGSGNEWREYEVPYLGPIHRIIIRNTEQKTFLIAISYDQIRAIDITFDTGVFD